ncbi:MAG: hypothetical protein R3C53_14910 [Pirellulaceae bacterium]
MIGAGPQLGKRVGQFKSFTATSIIKCLHGKRAKTLLQELAYYKLRHKVDQTHQLWQEGSHPQVIETEEMMWQKIEYIHNNPLRRGYVDEARTGVTRVPVTMQVGRGCWRCVSIGGKAVRFE